MGESWSTCYYCGEPMSDYRHDIQYCENCDREWCCVDCAEEDGFIKNEDGSTSCSHCRGENFNDSELLGFALEMYSNTRENLIKEYKEYKLDKGE